MKANKKGISLIVLVITIIVIIILAAAIILSLNNNNPIAKANEAVTASDKAEAQSALTTWLGYQMAEHKNVVSIEGPKTIGATPIDVGAKIGTVAANPAISLDLETLGLDEAVIEYIKIENNKVTEVKKK